MAKKPKCKECPCWEFTETLGSPDVPVWHCRHGFSPSESCQEMAKYKSLTKSIFTRWWWKRKADKLSEQVDKLGELIDQHIEKGGDQ